MYNREIILMIIIPFLFNLFFIPFVIKIANHIGAMDIPDQRKVHKQPIPRLGGLGIFFSFLLGYVLFGEMSLRMNAILIGSFIILITGIVDDINPIPAKYKFLCQILSASVVASVTASVVASVVASSVCPQAVSPAIQSARASDIVNIFFLILSSSRLTH